MRWCFFSFQVVVVGCEHQLRCHVNVANLFDASESVCLRCVDMGNLDVLLPVDSFRHAFKMYAHMCTQMPSNEVALMQGVLSESHGTANCGAGTS